MIELSPGKQVFIYSILLDTAIEKSRVFPWYASKLLLRIKDTEITGCNLTGYNNKTALDKDIIESIVGEFNIYFVTMNMPKLLGLSRFKSR